jgi:Right handed beta helix region
VLSEVSRCGADGERLDRQLGFDARRGAPLAVDRGVETRQALERDVVRSGLLCAALGRRQGREDAEVAGLRRTKQAALALAVGLLASTGFTGVATAHTRECGDVITADEELHNDIGPCHGDGLIVMGSNITVNLNGHQIFGEGGLVVEHQAAGVRVLGQRNVVVTNGTLRNFYHGVRVTQGSHNRITAVRVVDNQGGNGVVLENSSDNHVDGNVVVGNGRFSGISTFDSVSLPAGSARNTITNNLLNMNNFMGAHGVSVESGTGHTVIRNQVVASGRDGISLFPRVSDTLVESNVVRNSGRHGVNVQDGSRGNVVRSNQAIANVQSGILVAGQANRILGNRAASNGSTDLRDANLGNTCDANTWSANTFGTASPACTQG